MKIATLLKKLEPFKEHRVSITNSFGVNVVGVLGKKQVFLATCKKETHVKDVIAVLMTYPPTYKVTMPFDDGEVSDEVYLYQDLKGNDLYFDACSDWSSGLPRGLVKKL